MPPSWGLSEGLTLCGWAHCRLNGHTGLCLHQPLSVPCRDIPDAGDEHWAVLAGDGYFTGRLLDQLFPAITML